MSTESLNMQSLQMVKSPSKIPSSLGILTHPQTTRLKVLLGHWTVLVSPYQLAKAVPHQRGPPQNFSRQEVTISPDTRKGGTCKKNIENQKVKLLEMNNPNSRAWVTHPTSEARSWEASRRLGTNGRTLPLPSSFAKNPKTKDYRAV